MSQRINVFIPEAFSISPFYEEKVSVNVLENISVEEGINTSPFLFEILDNLGVKGHKPWLNREATLPIVLNRWRQEKQKLSEIYKVRQKNKATSIMILQIANFLSSLFWANGKAITNLKKWKAGVPLLKIKPVNVEERLEFVIQGPQNYHSYIQLNELFLELEKQFSKAVIMQKKKPYN